MIPRVDIIPVVKDLIRRLRGLSAHEHDDHTTGDEAADFLEENFLKGGKIKKDKELKYVRLRFKTKSVEDWRPIHFPPPGPYWCSGYAGDNSYAVIILYLPVGADLKKYWPEAFDIESENCDKIEYSDRFPKPEWFKG